MTANITESFANTTSSLAQSAQALEALSRSLQSVAIKALGEQAKVINIAQGMPAIAPEIASSPFAQAIGLADVLANLGAVRHILASHADALGVLSITASTQADQVETARAALLSVTLPQEPAPLPQEPRWPLETSQETVAPPEAAESQPEPRKIVVPAFKDAELSPASEDRLVEILQDPDYPSHAGHDLPEADREQVLATAANPSSADVTPPAPLTPSVTNDTPEPTEEKEEQPSKGKSRGRGRKK